MVCCFWLGVFVDVCGLVACSDVGLEVLILDFTALCVLCCDCLGIVFCLGLWFGLDFLCGLGF